MGKVDRERAPGLPSRLDVREDKTPTVSTTRRRAGLPFGAVHTDVQQDPFPWFVGAVVIVYLGIFLQQLALGADTRSSVYLFESALIFFLPLLLAGLGVRKLSGASDRWDVLVFGLIVAGVFVTNIVLSPITGLSSRLGFVDASAFLIAFLFLFYGRRRLRRFALPVSLIFVFVAIVYLVSFENRIFMDLAGGYFIRFTVWTAAGLLQLFGENLTVGPSFYIIYGASNLKVAVGIRCGGLDVALIYSLILAAFLSQLSGRREKKVALLVVAVLGAVVLNSFRVTILTLIYLNYGIELGDTVHTNLGDLMFLVYVAGFWWGARRVLSHGAEVSGTRED